MHFAVVRSARFGFEGLPRHQLLAEILGLPELKAIADERDKAGYTALHIACMCPDYRTIKILVEKGELDIFKKPKSAPRKTPLRMVLLAAKHPRKDDSDRDVHGEWHKLVYRSACYLKERMGESAGMQLLHIAAQCGYVEEVKKLVEMDQATVLGKNKYGLTAREELASLLRSFH